MGYQDLVNRFSATRAGSWLARNTAARVDPWLFRVSRGRLTFTGVPTLPMLRLTTTGRRSEQPRSVQLAYLRDGDDYVVVASNFGQEHHPAWMHNLLANPSARVQVGAEELEVEAALVADDEKPTLWPRLDGVVPQLRTYRQRTDRDIRIFRLRPC